MFRELIKTRKWWIRISIRGVYIPHSYYSFKKIRRIFGDSNVLEQTSEHSTHSHARFDSYIPCNCIFMFFYNFIFILYLYLLKKYITRALFHTILCRKICSTRKVKFFYKDMFPCRNKFYYWFSKRIFVFNTFCLFFFMNANESWRRFESLRA